jgi:hypothetical protein
MAHVEGVTGLALMQAAEALTSILTAEGVRHAYIGGFALRVLGSSRSTDDVDVEVDVADSTARLSLLQRIIGRDARFSSNPLAKLFFTPSDPPGPPVRVEVLPVGTLGLPPLLPAQCVEISKASIGLRCIEFREARTTRITIQRADVGDCSPFISSLARQYSHSYEDEARRAVDRLDAAAVHKDHGKGRF